MNVSSAILGLLDFIKDDLLQKFEVVDTFIYDENLDFRGRASQYISRTGIFQRAEGETPKDWILLIWNRSSINDSNYNNRPYAVTARFDNLTSLDEEDYPNSTALTRLASIDVEIKMTTNNINIAERLEEYFYVKSGEMIDFEADYGDIGLVRCSAQPSRTTTFEKEDMNELGPVIAVGLTVNLNFPVVLDFELAPVIENINERLWVSLENPVLIEENSIEEIISEETE